MWFSRERREFRETHKCIFFTVRELCRRRISFILYILRCCNWNIDLRKNISNTDTRRVRVNKIQKHDREVDNQIFSPKFKPHKCLIIWLTTIMWVWDIKQLVTIYELNTNHRLKQRQTKETVCPFRPFLGETVALTSG